MTISSYFKHTTSTVEQTLMEDLSRETIQIKGLDFAYIPRDASDADELFGEDVKSTFDTSVTLEMYCKQMTGFEGEGDFFSRFGLDIRDEAVFQIHKKRFEAVVTIAYPTITRPREGDLIYFELANTLLEISFVEKEKPFYQRGIQTLWEVNVKKFEYNHDDMSTGITEVDAIETADDVGDDSTTIQTESDTFMDFDEHDPFSSNDY
jgi:hypothetical protein